MAYLIVGHDFSRAIEWRTGCTSPGRCRRGIAVRPADRRVSGVGFEGRIFVSRANAACIQTAPVPLSVPSAFLERVWNMFQMKLTMLLCVAWSIPITDCCP